MPEPNDGSLDATLPSNSSQEQIEMPEGIPVDIPTNVMGAMNGHMMNGAQRQADGAAAYAENLRYEYLQGKNGVSAAEAVGEQRMNESGSGKSRNTEPSGK